MLDQLGKSRRHVYYPLQGEAAASVAFHCQPPGTLLLLLPLLLLLSSSSELHQRRDWLWLPAAGVLTLLLPLLPQDQQQVTL